MSLKGKQAPLKEAFAFLGSLTSKYPAKQDGEHEVRIYELTIKGKQGGLYP